MSDLRSTEQIDERRDELKRVMGPGLLLLFIVGDILGTGIYALTGTVANNPDGSVEFHAQGPDEKIDELVRLVTETPSSRRRPGRVSAWRVGHEAMIANERRFDISFY